MQLCVVKGVRYRVQLIVYDFTDPEKTPAPLLEERPKFVVSVLPAAANPYCAFARGSLVYYGDDPELAWAAMYDRVEGLLSKIPDRVLDYLNKWRKNV